MKQTVKIQLRTIMTAFALSATLLVSACETVNQGPTLTNRPTVEQKNAKPPVPSLPEPQNVEQSQNIEMARVQPNRPRLQTGMEPKARLGGARPPILPSLEELLGRMPKAHDGSFKEPPLAPMVHGRRVAILLPLTGVNGQVGNALLNAAQMALFDFADQNFELLVHDTQGTPEGANEAARLAIGDGATLIIGPLLSSSVRGVSDIARAASVPVMAFSSDRTVVGNGVYTMGFFPGDEVRRVVQYAYQKGARRFALLTPMGAYGKTVLQALQDTVTSLGAELSKTQFYAPSAQDFSEPVKRLANFNRRRQNLLDQRKILKERNDEVGALALKRLENLQTIGEPPFDALLVADGGKRLVAVAAMLPFYDIDPNKVMILGTGQWDVKGLGTEPALVGGWYAAPDPKQRQDFSDQYFNVFGKRPHRLATLAYDAMALAVVLGNQNRGDVYGPQVLSQSGGFTGRDGIFRFAQDGAVERGLAILKIDRTASQVIDAAPSAFAH